MANFTSLTTTCLLFALLFAAVSCFTSLSVPESSSSSGADGSLELEMITSLAKTALYNHNIQKRAVELVERQARALIPAEFSLAGLGLFGTFKAVIIALGTIFAFGTFLPAVLSFLGIASPVLPIRSLSDSMNEVNYIVARSINDLGSTIQNKSYFLELDGPECRDRAICEVGKFVGRSYPSISIWLQRLGGFDKLILGDQYSLAMVKGIRQQKCEHLYSQCKRDPFATWTEIAEKFR